MEFLTKHSTVTNSALKLVAMVLLVVLPIMGFALGIQYQNLLNYQGAPGIQMFTPSNSTKVKVSPPIDRTLTNSPTLKPSVLPSPQPTTLFQTLLGNECKIVSAQEQPSNFKYYGIGLDKLPLTLSQEVKQKYNIDQNILCGAGGISFENGKSRNILLLTAQSEYEIPNSELLIGDELSRNLGMAPPQVSYELQNDTYYKTGNKEPHTLVSNNGLKTIVAFSLPSPYCPRENSNLTVDLLTFKELEEYKLAINTHFSFSLNDDMKTLFIKHAEKRVSTEPDGDYAKGDYQLCQIGEFEKEFFSRYMNDYNSTATLFKDVIDNNIEDLSGITLR